jgi:serine protease AprX
MKYSFYTILFLTILVFPSEALKAQKRFWVFLADKSGVEFDPYEYFDPATIRNRQEKQIPLIQFSDLPLREDYLTCIKQITGTIGTSSRWFNAVAVKADNKTIHKISKLPFVIDIQEIKLVSTEAGGDFNDLINFDNDQLRESQINAFGLKNFEDMGIDGSGVRIAVFDGGFPGVDTSPMFRHLRESGRIIATWDFVKNKEFVYDYSSHGTSVLTCIAGILDNKKFGLAPGAEFLLARTEVSREVFSEEENWLAAVEWADKNGADIISSSLGYTYKRYFPNEMDGKSTLVSRSANMAASKGMLVINAAGNDGDKKWEVIGAPADADSVLSIGGVSPDNGYHIDFSSYGPTFDGRMKPNLVAFGKVTSSNDKKVKQVYGTSFATPLVAGFAACVMQIHPEWNNMETFRELEKSGHLFPYFDYAHGFGVPQASYFTTGKPIISPTFEFNPDDENLKIIVIKGEPQSYSSPDNDTVEIVEPFSDEVRMEEEQEVEEQPIYEKVNEQIELESGGNEKNAEGYRIDGNFLYFHIIRENEQKIKRYALVNMQFQDEFNIPCKDLDNGDMIAVYFKGYVGSYIYNGK